MFPDFNQWSLPLLILVVQGLLFVGLLFYRYIKFKNTSDLLLALILLLTCYTQICYTVGFMGWYNEFRTTKINYFLINIGTAIAPLIYLYVTSVTTSKFSIQKKHLWHFVLPGLLVLYRLTIYGYDLMQPGFHETQNGYLKIHLDEAYVQAIFGYIEPALMLIYLAFTFQLFFNYRKKILQYFSNTYKLELNWVLSFLILFSVLFLYGTIQDILGAHFMELGYQQRWWLNLLTAIVTLYLGISGYFVNANKLNKLSFQFNPSSDAIPESSPESAKSSSYSQEEINSVIHAMESEHCYLNPDLNLSELAAQVGLSRGKVSEII
ncbi:MAG: AraC family transcriptional regulator, partial [Bacteroidota bacterium]|nr:AraC family transcriptional regulator [Bacteroidota bacterium]